MPNPAQQFDGAALGENPPKIGNTADPAWPTGGGPSAHGVPAKVIQTDGTANLNADQTQKGPTHFASPSQGVHTWPSKVDSFNGEKV